MRLSGPWRSRSPRRAHRVGVALSLAVLVVGCADTDPPGAIAPPGATTSVAPPRVPGADGERSGTPGSFDAPDAPVVGAQGGRGQFAVECALDQLLSDDPIVKPGRPGAAHLHAFFGARGVTADSTYEGLLASPTTCDQQLDTASYWAPVLIGADDEPVRPTRSIAYYRVAEAVDAEVVQPYPPGLSMVAGDAHADAAQPLSAVSWSCGVSPELHPAPPDCRFADTLRMSITFPDCWNGRDVVAPDPAYPSTHVAYSHDGNCPDGFGVQLPQLQFVVEYLPVDPDVVSLSSGSPYSGHADFWNGWQQDKLTREVEHCLRRQLPCRISRSPRSLG